MPKSKPRNLARAPAGAPICLIGIPSAASIPLRVRHAQDRTAHAGTRPANHRPNRLRKPAALESGAAAGTQARQEILRTSAGRSAQRSAASSERKGEGVSLRTHVHVAEESHQAAVPLNGPIKRGQPLAQGLEGWAWAKNAGQPGVVCPPRQRYGLPIAARLRNGIANSTSAFV